MRELAVIKRKIGAKFEYSDNGSSSDMEANYDDIQYEEKQSMKIARREDAAELLRIEQEEREEREKKKRLKRKISD